MKLLNIYGRLVNKNVNRYRIDWDKKSRSKLQTSVKEFLYPYWKNMIVYEEFPVYGSKMKVDFLNASLRIAIEVNGAQHGSFNKFFHNNSRSKYLASIGRDYDKYIWLTKNNFKVIEIEQDEVPNLTKKFILEKFSIEI